MPAQRLDKIITGSGHYSRSEARALINGGRVSVGAAVAGSASDKYDPDSDRVLVDGAPLEYKKFRYVVMNKPVGYVSSTADRREKTVIDLLDDKYAKLGLFPAGRLDKDASGLLLLTNDGWLAHKITSPAGKIGKRYFLRTAVDVIDGDIMAFSEGLTLGDGTKCLPAILEPAAGGAFVTVFEGKYHQVKRMMAAIGKPVVSLKRVSIGGLELDGDLAPGQYRELTDEMVTILYNNLQNGRKSY